MWVPGGVSAARRHVPHALCEKKDQPNTVTQYRAAEEDTVEERRTGTTEEGKGGAGRWYKLKLDLSHLATSLLNPEKARSRRARGRWVGFLKVSPLSIINLLFVFVEFYFRGMNSEGWLLRSELIVDRLAEATQGISSICRDSFLRASGSTNHLRHTS